MLRYLLNKVGYSILVMFGVVTAVFFLFTVLPGDPARMMLDQREDSEQLAAIKHKYGFDQPVSKQYLYYLNDLSPLSLHATDEASYTRQSLEYTPHLSLFTIGETQLVLKWPYLRQSFRSQGKTVSAIIGETLPNTIVLALASIVIAMLLGVFLGVIAALLKDTFADRAITVIGTLGMSVPSFFSAILMAWIFGYLLAEYTGLNMTGSLYEVDDMGEGIHLKLRNLILPAITLGIRPLGVIIQLTRGSLLEEMGQDYIRTARAKGLKEGTIVRKHALKNALNPVITAASGWFASMLAGAVFVEYIFGWNGLGKQIVEALNQLDLPVVMGAVLVIGFTFVIINILVDILYAWLDPRVRV
ncbi:MAG: ABC transporter permease [Owenweeksia sp.]